MRSHPKKKTSRTARCGSSGGLLICTLSYFKPFFFNLFGWVSRPAGQWLCTYQKHLYLDRKWLYYSPMSGRADIIANRLIKQLGDSPSIATYLSLHRPARSRDSHLNIILPRGQRWDTWHSLQQQTSTQQIIAADSLGTAPPPARRLHLDWT